MAAQQVFAIVLAAGFSRRFGGCKLLAEYRGESLIRHAVRTAESVCGANTVVVFGDEWRAVHAACAPLRGFLLRNDQPDAGMASSIAAGVGAVAGSADAILLMLGDQPLVDTACLKNVIAAWHRSDDRIACSAYAGVLGPPTVFPARYFAELMQLRGDRGARQLLDRYADRVLTVPSALAAIDIDTQADLADAERL